MRWVTILILPFFCLAAVPQQEIDENINFLEMYKRYQEIYDVHKMKSETQRAIDGISKVNFAMKPYVAPIKSFDALYVHHVYPLKVFLPAGATVTAARLSNSTQQPSFSQNVVTVDVTSGFESGILDVVFVENTALNNGQFLSIKLDKYLPSDEELSSIPLYTQARYYTPEVLSNQDVIARLKPDELTQKHSKIEYQGKVYNVFLVSVTESGKTLARHKDDQYINASIVKQNRQYNYQIQSGEVR